MNSMSHMDAMRELIRTEMVPRVIDFHATTDELPGYYHCNICGVDTLYSAKCAAASMATHTTFCKLGRILGVIE